MNRNLVQINSADHQATGSLVRQLFVAAANAAWRLVWSWQYRYHYRRELGELDDHLLRDIGISRLDARVETRKPFWRY